MKNYELRVGAGCAVIHFPERLFPTDGLCGVHDEPHVRLMVLESGIRVAIAAVEMVNLPADVIEAGKKQIREKTGTDLENIWIHATHAITTPHAPRDPSEMVKGQENKIPQKYCEKRELYEKAVDEAFEEASIGAAASFQPAKLGFGSGFCDINRNRDILTPYGWWVGIDPDGPSNKKVQVLRADNLSGKPIGFLISYGLKPCAIDNAEMEKGTRLVSADVPGAACTRLESQFGVPCLFVVSAAADQVPREQAWGDLVREDGTVGKYDFGVQKGLEIVERLGKEMAEAIAPILSSAIGTETEPRIVCEKTSVPVRTKTRNKMLPTRDPIYTEDGEEYILEAEIIAIGDTAFVAVKPEVDTQTESRLQEASPYANTLLMSMVNGSKKYMPCKEAYDRGTWEALSSMLMPGAAEKWVKVVTETMGAMKKQRIENRYSEAESGI